VNSFEECLRLLVLIELPKDLGLGVQDVGEKAG
jgi:hypothetical protein